MFDLYNNIALLCEKHGISTTRACELAGLSRSTLSNLRNGRAQTLSVKNAKKIADVLGESFDAVMHGIVEGKSAQPQEQLSDTAKELLSGIDDLTEDEMLLMLDMIKAIKSRRKP